MDPLRALTKDEVFFEVKDEVSPGVFKTLGKLHLRHHARAVELSFCPAITVSPSLEAVGVSVPRCPMELAYLILAAIVVSLVLCR